MCPTKPLRFCNWPGCNELGAGRYCAKHQAEADEKRAGDKARHDKTRGNAAERGYNATWQRVRRMKLARSPLCSMCEEQGRIVPAVLVHHVRAISAQGERLDPRNLMSLCQPCHEAIHGPDRWRTRQ